MTLFHTWTNNVFAAARVIWCRKISASMFDYGGRLRILPAIACSPQLVFMLNADVVPSGRADAGAAG
jgi:hypothetical protein